MRTASLKDKILPDVITRSLDCHLFTLLIFLIRSPHVTLRYMAGNNGACMFNYTGQHLFWFILRTVGLVVPSLNEVKGLNCQVTSKSLIWLKQIRT